jgi:S-adenosylmethionine/arginine decarboxylase-like enzyme
VESLGYGTHLIIDGFSATTESLLDKNMVNACLQEVAGMLEATQAELLSAEDQTGISATLKLTESHVSLHTFSTFGTLSLHIFSRHDLRPGDMTDALGKHFGVRRVESHLSNHSRTLPQDQAARQRALLGDRAYSALRLDTSL